MSQNDTITLDVGTVPFTPKKNEGCVFYLTTDIFIFLRQALSLRGFRGGGSKSYTVVLISVYGGNTTSHWVRVSRAPRHRGLAEQLLWPTH